MLSRRLLFIGSFVESRAVAKAAHGGRRRLRPFIDCRRSPTVHATATKLSLTQLNLVVWAKTNGGMGSRYRSLHELPRVAVLGRSVSCRLELRWDPSKAKGG